jgi:hypothetical protein
MVARQHKDDAFGQTRSCRPRDARHPTRQRFQASEAPPRLCEHVPAACSLGHGTFIKWADCTATCFEIHGHGFFLNAVTFSYVALALTRR